MTALSPRATRITDLASRAYERERLAGAGAIDAAISRIERTFGENRIINDRKLAVENAVRRGAGAIRTRHAYGEIAFAVLPDVDQALAQVNRLLRADEEVRSLRAKLWLPQKHITAQHHLQEARIFLRWYRRFGDRKHFPAIIDALTTSTVYAVEIDHRKHEVA